MNRYRERSTPILFSSVNAAIFMLIIFATPRVSSLPAPNFEKPWRVVVLGGTGFMGRETVSALLSRGHRVVMINRGYTPNPFKTMLSADNENDNTRNLDDDEEQSVHISETMAFLLHHNFSSIARDRLGLWPMDRLYAATKEELKKELGLIEGLRLHIRLKLNPNFSSASFDLSPKNIRQSGQNTKARKRRKTTKTNKKKQKKHQHPGIKLKHIKVDRINDRDKFKHALKTMGYIHIIIDFIGFHGMIMQDTIDALRNVPTDQDNKWNVGLYIFISSESIFMSKNLPPHNNPLSEDELVRPNTANDDQFLAERNPHQFQYGGNKLECERALQRAHFEDQFPAVVLRLPSVMGPYDNLGAFASYVGLIASNQSNIPLGTPVHRRRQRSGDPPIENDPHGKNYKWSVVYSRDVVRSIFACIDAKDSVQGEIFHIANQEAITLTEWTNMIASAVNKLIDSSVGSKVVVKPDYTTECILPGVDFGAMNVSKAISQLNWEPTPIQTWLDSSVLWYFSDTTRFGYHEWIKRHGANSPQPTDNPRQFDYPVCPSMSAKHSFEDLQECHVSGTDYCHFSCATCAKGTIPSDVIDNCLECPDGSYLRRSGDSVKKITGACFPE